MLLAIESRVLEFLPECIELLPGAGILQGESGREDADEDQHDQPHPLLAIVGSVREANPGAGEHEQGADPTRWRMIGIRSCVELRIADQDLHDDQEKRRDAESDGR